MASLDINDPATFIATAVTCLQKKLYPICNELFTAIGGGGHVTYVKMHFRGGGVFFISFSKRNIWYVANCILPPPCPLPPLSVYYKKKE